MLIDHLNISCGFKGNQSITDDFFFYFKADPEQKMFRTQNCKSPLQKGFGTINWMIFRKVFAMLGWPTK